MSTIKGLSERILRQLNGGEVQRDSQWHQLDIEYLVRDAAATLIKGEWYQERNEGGKTIDPRYVVTFEDQEVKVDDRTNENYVEIPVGAYIRLPNQAGIRSVRPSFKTTGTKRTKTSETRAFIPIPNRFEDIYYQLPAAALEQLFGYMIRKDRLYFTKKSNKTLKEYEINAVDIDIVTVDPKAVDVDDPLPLSEEMNMKVREMVIAMITGGKPQVVDTINDDNPNVTRAE
jgi:hypothetical protein